MLVERELWWYFSMLGCIDSLFPIWKGIKYTMRNRILKVGWLSSSTSPFLPHFGSILPTTSNTTTRKNPCVDVYSANSAIEPLADLRANHTHTANYTDIFLYWRLSVGRWWKCIFFFVVDLILWDTKSMGFSFFW